MAIILSIGAILLLGLALYLVLQRPSITNQVGLSGSANTVYAIGQTAALANTIYISQSDSTRFFNKRKVRNRNRKK